MAKFVDTNMDFFLSQILSDGNRLFVACGAGRKLKQLCEIYHFEDRLLFIVDNNAERHDKALQIGNFNVPVFSFEKLKGISDREDVTILITTVYMIGIVEQLSQVEYLRDKEVFILPYLQDNCKNEIIKYTEGPQKIPKIIHYCWFGPNEIPDEQKEYIEGWHHICPDYKIMKWDESNYDVHKNRYMSEAYKNGKWGFVPDYARLDILYRYGGIYLDTDVEIIKPFDDMLNDDAFIGFGSYDVINAGAGIGAAAGNEMIRELRDYYDETAFVRNDGKLDMRPCTDHQYSVLKRYNVRLNNTQQNIKGLIIYPMEVLSPLGVLNVVDKNSVHTHSIHRITASWEKKENVIDYVRGKDCLRDYLSGQI